MGPRELRVSNSSPPLTDYSLAAQLPLSNQHDYSQRCWYPRNRQNALRGLHQAQAPHDCDQDSIRSAKSYESINVLGMYPLGTLRLVDHVVDAEMEEPRRVLTPPRSDPMVHDLGGGDVCIALDIPQFAPVGYDLFQCSVNKFDGVREMPHGTHFFWAAHPDATHCRSGFFVVNTKSQHRTHVGQWSKWTDSFVPPIRAIRRWQGQSVKDSFYSLPSYYNPPSDKPSQRLQQAEKAHSLASLWQDMSNCISARLLNRMLSDQELGDGWNLHTLDNPDGPFGKLIVEDQRQPRPFLQAHSLRFCFPRRTRGMYFDASSYIVSWLHQGPDDRWTLTEDDIIGELQFVYIMAAFLHNQSCAQHWWLLVPILLRGRRLHITRPSLASRLVSTIAAQLTHCSKSGNESLLLKNAHKTLHLRIAIANYRRRSRDRRRHRDALQAQADAESLARANAEDKAAADLGQASINLGWDPDAISVLDGHGNSINKPNHNQHKTRKKNKASLLNRFVRLEFPTLCGIVLGRGQDCSQVSVVDENCRVSQVQEKHKPQIVSSKSICKDQASHETLPRIKKILSPSTECESQSHETNSSLAKPSHMFLEPTELVSAPVWAASPQ
ncbi:hypothetical protein CDD81_1097 [Ophiocordyceps australis]|uniref:Uncharacterized protein n=1 Tax=Ophiocordyceps australis TaxID=1399860 RepID=A0A2C5Y0E1_9HYPO|nr:hypothetical protein CDD81_1097 [Ophiocordyceps australis]